MAAIPSLASNEFVVRPLPDRSGGRVAARAEERADDHIDPRPRPTHRQDCERRRAARSVAWKPASSCTMKSSRRWCWPRVRGCRLHGKGHRLKIGQEGMVGHVAATGRMHYAPDVRKDRYYICCENLTLSEVAIPLKVGDRLVGVFTASHPRLGCLSTAETKNSAGSV